MAYVLSVTALVKPQAARLGLEISVQRKAGRQAKLLNIKTFSRNSLAPALNR